MFRPYKNHAFKRSTRIKVSAFRFGPKIWISKFQILCHSIPCHECLIRGVAIKFSQTPSKTCTSFYFCEPENGRRKHLSNYGNPWFWFIPFLLTISFAVGIWCPWKKKMHDWLTISFKKANSLKILYICKATLCVIDCTFCSYSFGENHALIVLIPRRMHCFWLRYGRQTYNLKRFTQVGRLGKTIYKSA